MPRPCRLQLSISAKNLKNIAGFFNQSDPFAIVTLRGDNQDNPPTVLGHTEVRLNDLNPTFASIIIIEEYRFGVPLYIEVGIFDFQSKATGKSEAQLAAQSSEVAHDTTKAAGDADVLVGLRQGTFRHKVMGTALFEVGEVLGSRGNVASKHLQFGSGAVYVHIEKSRQDAQFGKIRFQLRGQSLHNKQTLGRKSSPFFEIYRRVEKPTGAAWTNVYKSNVVKSNLDPIWEAASLELETFCNGDLNRIIKIVVYDHRKASARKKIIGEFETSVQNLIDAAGKGTNSQPFAFELTGKDVKHYGTVHVMDAYIISPGGRKNNGGSNYQQQIDKQQQQPAVPPDGRPKIPHQISVVQRPEFLDYLSGGCQISLAVAIDFTASNGNPGQEGTPHYFHPESPNAWNDYEKAIFAVGSILAKYDTDQKFPVWGFGAKYDNLVRHCFQCGDDVEVQGVNGILDAYRGVFQTPLTMSYPTDFTQVIRTAAQYAQHEYSEADECGGKLSYTILLLLTAGNIENIQETKNELIEASKTPLSIVIVGIGDTDFSAMEFLDEHDGGKDSGPSSAGRDITKFVQFSDYRSYNALTEAVLDEIPDQLVDFYFEQGIMPGKAEDADFDNVEIQPPDDDERTYTYFDDVRH